MITEKRGLIYVVFGVFLLILLSTFISAEIEGCYVFPQASEDLYCLSGILDVEVESDCADYEGCSLNQHFIPGSDCSELEECKVITCNVDCQTHARGKCTQLGGEAVADEDYALWCSPGCCKIADNQFCQFNLFKFQCLDKAEKLGFSDLSNVIFDNSLGMDAQKCNQVYCQLEVEPVTLKILVKDETVNLIPGADVTLQGTSFVKVTNSAGESIFEQLNAGTYAVQAEKEGYYPASVTVSLIPGESVQYNLTLQEVSGVATVLGKIMDGRGNPLAGATVSWSGPLRGQVYSGDLGEYLVEGLPEGEYTFTVSKVGFESKQRVLTLIAGSFPYDFSLNEAAVRGVSGTTYLDINNNKELDLEDELVYGAKIYIDGIFKGYSQYDPQGNFMVEIDPSPEEGEQQHTISATYQNYFYEEETFELIAGESIENKVLLLTTYSGICTEPGTEREVEQFIISPVFGEEAIKLEWVKPCPEVIGYEIKKVHQGEEQASLQASPAENVIIDNEVKWGEDYTYKIIVYYDKGRFVESSTEYVINVGDELCAGRYDPVTGWETFCLVGTTEERKKVWTCNYLNQLVIPFDCAEKDGQGEDYYCASIGSGVAECRNAGGCGLFGQQADPFGLYYSRNNCYGTADPEEGTENFCYFDYSETIVDQCNDCTEVKNCVDYNGQDACEVNNCLGVDCAWKDGAANNLLVDYSLINLPLLVTPETGAGYCVQEGYQKDDLCSLCGPKANVFENFYCTAEVCSGLGQCFSNFELDQCNSCGENPSTFANCYTYKTELECVNQQAVSSNHFAEITLSEDQCAWGRCLWTGEANGFSQNGCVKDGDGNGLEDCAGFNNAGERRACRVDNSAPRTTVVPAGIKVVSLVSPNITFMGDDSYHEDGKQKNKLGVVAYCLTSAGSGTSTFCAAEDFVEVAYPGKDDQELVTVDLINSTFLREKKVKGETYRLKFYSKDKYNNQENVQEGLVYVDNVPPQFEVNEQIETVADTTSLAVYLDGTEEIMTCTFNLKQILPLGETETVTVAREEQSKSASFQDLKGIKYNLSVQCIDEQGNVNLKEREYVFDLEERITIINPPREGAVADREIIFEAETVAGASCALYLSSTNEKVTDFISDEQGKVHRTTAVSGFTEKLYAGEHKIVCQELLSEQSYEDYFNFRVDFTPPQTQIHLQEGAREELPIAYDWEEFFIESVALSFECIAEGFACAETFYCLGEGCDFIGDDNYQEYTSTIELLDSTEICYYSTDIVDNPVYQPWCGKIIIDGYGITLEKPPQYYYLDEKWGVSNIPIFDWQFFTKIPTIECKFDFAPNFVYETIPQHKTRQPNAEGRYLFENFPENVFTSYPEGCEDGDTSCVKEVYVKCKDGDGQLSPEQKIYLEYDSSAPQILEAEAEPAEVLEGITTKVFVFTDDKTLCKYSDGSDGEINNDYQNMGFYFPGEQDNILDIEHEDEFNINFVGPKKDYLLTTQCKNGAGDLSAVENITFTVDYSQQGYIVEGSLQPQGYTWERNLSLSLETSKGASCEYDFAGSGYIPFSAGVGTKFHQTEISISEEKEYLIPLKCVMGDHTAFAEMKFTLDFTAPVVSEVDDGSYSCGQEQLTVLAYTDEGNISGYYYEVYDQGSESGLRGDLYIAADPETEGNESSTSVATTSFNGFNSGFGLNSIGASNVLSGEVGPELPIKIPTADLLLNHRYTVKIKAIDAAGNEGLFAESEGVLITESNKSVCEDDDSVPLIEFVLNDSSCRATEVEMHCNDILGCQDIRYGEHTTSALCEVSKTYFGQKVSFAGSGWLCYYVEDNMGNNYSDLKRIVFDDEDGDGIRDGCDDCLSTGAGKIVNELGCADGEVPLSSRDEDTDGDSLPDYWEKNYDAVDCALSYASVDSNDNGVSDNEEDYDNDGYSNYEEFTSYKNPCIEDVAAVIEEREEVEDEDLYQPPEKEADVVALVFLILGLLMVLGGSGYLVYYYLYSSAGKESVAGTPSLQRGAVTPVAGASETKPGIISAWKEKLLGLRKTKAEKLKRREREKVFGGFSKDSKNIPHVNESLQKRAPHLSKLQDLADHYREHKKEINPGLRKEEKGIFARLEKISKETKEKKIHQVVDKDEAKDIFSKLRQLSKKRKEK